MCREREVTDPQPSDLTYIRYKRKQGYVNYSRGRIVARADKQYAIGAGGNKRIATASRGSRGTVLLLAFRRPFGTRYEFGRCVVERRGPKGARMSRVETTLRLTVVTHSRTRTLFYSGIKKSTRSTPTITVSRCRSQAQKGQTYSR